MSPGVLLETERGVAGGLPRTRPVRVALAGCGVVGGELGRRLVEDASELERRHGVRFELASVLVRDPSRWRPVDLQRGIVTDDPARFLATEADVVVEAIGGIEPALTLARAVLASGRRLVTANKALLAEHGAGLAALARASGARLDFEAAVGGGIPVLRAFRDQLAGADVARVSGILNGTCNFILSRLADGATAASALQQAQAFGYAEADPSRDLSGADAADKLKVLAWLAFGCDPAWLRVRTRGILPGDRLAADAAALGGCVRLVAEAARDERGVWAVVEPVVVDRGGALGAVAGPDNLVVIETRWNGVVRLGGPGAGGEPTASALLGDLVSSAAPLPPIRAGLSAAPEPERDWVVSTRPGHGAERLLLATLERAGTPARRVVWAPDAVRAIVPAVRWRQLELALRSLEGAGLAPLACRIGMKA